MFVDEHRAFSRLPQKWARSARGAGGHPQYWPNTAKLHLYNETQSHICASPVPRDVVHEHMPMKMRVNDDLSVCLLNGVIMLLFVLQIFVQIIIQWKWSTISSGLDSLECDLLNRFEVIRRPFSHRYLECEWQHH